MLTMEELGYFIYMDEQEKKKQPKELEEPIVDDNEGENTDK